MGEALAPSPPVSLGDPHGGHRSGPKIHQSLCDTSHMTTKLDLDPDLLEWALEVSGEKTEQAAVTRAREEFVVRREQAGLIELFGQIEWDPDCD